MQADCFFKRKENIAWRTIEDTTFLVNPSTKKIYPLDEVGRVIWNGLEEKRDRASLAQMIYNEFDVDLKTANRDISDFLEQLFNDGLVEKTG